MALWIDTDMGFDDLAAVLVLTHAGTGIDGLSLVAGNSPLETVRRNAAAARDLFGWEFPIYTGREEAILGGLETAQAILGPRGMQSIGLHLPDRDPVAERSAFEALCRWLEQPTEGEKHILALGPLGNIAALATARPDLASKIDQVTWMGGAFGRGNHTPHAEYNAFADPEAVDIVLSHKIPIRMVELDLCRQVTVDPDDITPIRAAGGTNAALLADLTEGYVNIALSRGRPAMSIFDPLAAVAVIAPNVVRFANAAITVDTGHGDTRGRTRIDPDDQSSALTQYGAEVDINQARRLVLDALKAEAAK
jgi:inosine-uridine nucleoside N-ribohydrolase